MNPKLPELLRQQLATPQSFRVARRAFESDLSYGRYNGPAPHDAGQAAVMILLYPGATDWQLPLTRRPAQLRPHGGQISLPGGVVERPETSEQAAVRELEEELGVEAHRVQILGRLSDLYVFASNNLVTPWIGFTTSAPNWRPETAEVAEVLEISVGHLVDRTSSRVRIREKNGVQFRSPYIACGDHDVWGATSMILGEFIAALRDAAPA